MNLHWLWVYGVELLAMLCCAWAFLRGGPVERYGAALILLSWEVTIAVQSHDGTGPGIWVTIDDIVLFLALAALATWSRRAWTVVVAAFQLNAVAAHFAAPFAQVPLFSYVTAFGIWGGPASVMALAGGMIAWERALARTGPAPRDAGAVRWPYYLLLAASVAFMLARVTHNVPFRTPYLFH